MAAGNTVIVFGEQTAGSGAEAEGGESEAVQLVREIVRWARTLGATEIRDLHRHNDITPGRLADRSGGETLHTVFVRLK